MVVGPAQPHDPVGSVKIGIIQQVLPVAAGELQRFVSRVEAEIGLPEALFTEAKADGIGGGGTVVGGVAERAFSRARVEGFLGGIKRIPGDIGRDAIPASRTVAAGAAGIAPPAQPGVNAAVKRRILRLKAVGSGAGEVVGEGAAAEGELLGVQRFDSYGTLHGFVRIERGIRDGYGRSVVIDRTTPNRQPGIARKPAISGKGARVDRDRAA